MRSPSATVRLLLVSVVLPAVFVALDQAALRFGAAHRWSPATGVAVGSWFVVQTALLSFLAGLKLPHWGWRLLLLGWSLVLVNLLLATGAMDDRWNQRLLALAFLSAEFGASAAWLILGSASFPSRLCLVALAGVPVMYLTNVLHFDLAHIHWGDAWAIIVAAQIAGASGLVALLRVAGYRIEREIQDPADTSGVPVQFSIRHLLVVTTVVAILVPIVKGSLQSSSRWMDTRQWLHAAADGGVLALISLAALWAALGSGNWLIKIGFFALLAVAAGGGLYWLELTALYRQPYSLAPVPLTHAGWRWIAWTLLTGSFLAGMLLVLRPTGFRLVRRRR
ncbi:MAG TPA: hypothetical protein VNH11_24115 [Pirellulales bacterium]|nr:hypothetical protein [Pirellulales bacterium]